MRLRMSRVLPVTRCMGPAGGLKICLQNPPATWEIISYMSSNTQ
jgi:hypothetical protein